MSHARPLPSMLAALAIGLAGCTSTAETPAPAPPAAESASAPDTPADTDAAWPFVTSTRLGRTPGALTRLHLPVPAPVARRVATAAPAPRTPSTAAQILPALTGATFDRSFGAALDAAIAALPASRRDLGLAGVAADDLYGSPHPLCEDPHVLLTVDGADASLTVPTQSWYAGAPEPERLALSDTCNASLLEHPGDLAAAACTTADERAHFPEGSACRTCLEEDGDHARCVEAAACAETATWQVQTGGEWYGVLRVPTLLCAPDHVVDTYIFVENLVEGDPMPETFDHGGVAGSCAPGWDGEAVDLYCDFGDFNAVGDILYSRVDSIVSADSSAPTWDGRISLIRSLEVEGTTFDGAWLYEQGGTGISAPTGSVTDGWGLNPRDLRPGGVDPEDPDDTMARDYVAGFVLKMMTWRNGIMVAPANHNRCSDEAWVGPHADGTYSCDEPGAWATDAGWRDDALIAWWDQRAGEIYDFPLVTLASTGLPDPDVPGGLLTEVLGSTTLADAGWEGCTWPKTFVPDRVRLYDPQPGTSSEGYASFDGQTYRLGRDPEVDVRFFLATNQIRDFCPP